MNVIPVVLAGGIGERFWPLSRSGMPKQLHSIISNKTMLEDTLRRVSPLCSENQKPLVVTNQAIAEKIENVISPEIKIDIIAEPQGKNTAPAVALAAAWVQKNYGDAVMLIVSADHAISPQEDFIKTASYAVERANESDQLVVFGIKPNRPETGYGYIETAELLNEDNGNQLFKVKRFVEKPDSEKAERFMKSGNFLWNSGMFVWRTSVILEEFKKYMPQLFAQTEKLSSKNFSLSAIETFYSECEKESIDFGIMEHSLKTAVVAGVFNWDDIGSWESLSRVHGKNENQSTTLGKGIFEKDCQDSLIVNKSGKPLATIGLKNTAVIAVEDTFLVIERSRLPELKTYLEELKKNGEFPKDLF
ncbi:mannose-1-phosphate guanylyltransferase/mannose-6-phosphate isomerase [Chitinispirillum alkaliphilum]|nr:mannose-1-phosphate guanylyltransferase/mannose-6-phosphate isomerase [Chitinispirillum alkaliphilum]